MPFQDNKIAIRIQETASKNLKWQQSYCDPNIVIFPKNRLKYIYRKNAKTQVKNHKRWLSNIEPHFLKNGEITLRIKINA